MGIVLMVRLRIVLGIQNVRGMEGIPVYINKLEDAQKQSNRAGNPITDPTLLLFAENAMLRTDRFPRETRFGEITRRR